MCSVMSHCLVPYGLLPGSSVHGIFQARILECVAIFLFQGIFLIQGSNLHPLCLLHWQEDSLPLSHQVWQATWYQFSSVTQSSLTLCDPMDCSTSGFPVHHQLMELAQTHVHWVSDAIQPSHPLLSPSPLALNLPQHQGLFQWVSSAH